MDTMNADDRAMLAAVARREVIRNVIGNDEIQTWPPGGGQPVYEVPNFDALRRLRDAGLIALPVPGGNRCTVTLDGHKAIVAYRTADTPTI